MKTINKKISLINFTNDNRSKNEIKYLVYHYVGAVSTAKNNADYFYSKYRGASAHFFVDETSIWQVVEENDISWAVGNDTYKHKYCRNSNSISIEMCCKKDEVGNWYIEPETVQNAIELGQYLIAKYPNLNKREAILRHYDVTGKICPAPMVKHPELWTDLVDRLFNEKTEEPATEEIKNVNYVGQVTCDVLNVRKNHTTNSEIVEQVRKNDRFTIVGEYKNWGKLKTGNWVCLDYIKKTNDSKENKTNKTMKVNATLGLNVRKTPGGTKVGALAYGSIVTVIAEKDGWSKIGENKWVSSQYLTATIVNPTFKVGDYVRIKSSAKRYSTGQIIPNQYKNQVYTIMQAEKTKSLLRELYSWVNNSDLTK